MDVLMVGNIQLKDFTHNCLVWIITDCAHLYYLAILMEIFMHLYYLHVLLLVSFVVTLSQVWEKFFQN